MSHLTPLQKLAAGIHAVTGVSGAFAATQAAWRFFSNENITLRQLAQPLIDHVKQAIPGSCDQYVLAPCDWSFLDYHRHANKADRIDTGGLGYELFTALAVSDRDGRPLAPVCLQLEDARGVHTTRADAPILRASALDALAPVMGHVEGLGLGKPVVFIIDREADSVGHYRQWVADQRLFVVRAAHDRSVRHGDKTMSLSFLCEKLLKEGGFTHARLITWRDGEEVTQHVAEASVTLERPAKQSRKVHGVEVRKEVAGPPVTLRLIVSRVVDKDGKELSRWMLLTNVPASVDAATVALWYYWRWRIESCFKLLKQAGQQVEEWQQESARAIAARLLVASMACTLVWSLSRSQERGAGEVREMLVRLSGRQMGWKKGKGRATHTEPALMAGLMMLLPVLELLERHSPEQLRQMIAQVMPGVITAKPPIVV